ncbi:LOW QUALITY PROTEIN: uncharacterized protein [Panulirus ornatus]|uniref:LOW QUALITY PROTEIN: uncharacterized protein n=1 Tax=Panulirus ornatus TaxID=150431 RepID=UPI003A8A39C5
MRRVPVPGGHGRPKTQRVSSMFPCRSQPNMTLVGVRSVLTPRPYSAPQAALTTRGHTAGPGHAGRGGRNPENSISEVEDLTDQSDVPYSYAGQSNAGYGSLSLSRDSGNNTVDQSQDENESLLDVTTDLVEDDPPAAAAEDTSSAAPYRLVTQASRDSAVGSSTDGMTRDAPGEHHVQAPTLDTPRSENSALDSSMTRDIPDDHQVQTPPLDSPRELLETQEESQVSSDSEDGTVNRNSPDAETLIDNQDSEVGTEEDDEETEASRSSLVQPDADEGVPGSAEDIAPSREATTHTRSLQQQEVTSYCSLLDPEVPPTTHPLLPPTIVTSDLSGSNQRSGPCRSGINLQKVIDLRVSEAQRTGHLNLAKLGLPFFPSAVLLVDGSMIHRVSLQDNGLVEVPGASLTQLTSVTWLDLRYNLLQCLPQEVAALTQLQVLLLQGNRLTVLPVVLGTLPELTTLQVSDNPLSFPPGDVIEGGTRAILRFLKSQCQVGGHNHSLPPCPTRPPDAAYPEGNHDMRGNLARWLEDQQALDDGVVEGVCGGSTVSGGECGADGDVRCGSVASSAGEYSDSDSDSDDEYSEHWNHRPREGSSHEASRTTTPISPSTNFRIAIRSGDPSEGRGPSPGLPEEKDPTPGLPEGRDLGPDLPEGGDLALGHPDEHNLGLGLGLHDLPPDSGRDTLGRPASPSSACLLTPNTEIPSRPEYDLTREGDQGLDDAVQPEDDSTTWGCECFKASSSSISREKLQVINKIPDEAAKQRLLRSLGPGPDLLRALPSGTLLPESQGHFGGHRRALHLHLQGDYQLEDDMESLAGDLGEGYRRPHSEPLGDTETECHRQVSSLSLPVVSLQLPSVEEQQRGAAAGGSRRLRRTSRRPLEGIRRTRAPPGARRNQRDPHKPKLVTVAEVHRRAREERRRQREMLAAAREMAASQTLRTYGELEAWREETRLLQQEQQQQQHSLHPDSYVPAVCDAPFAVDGTTLTPRARSKMKRRADQRRSLSPSVSDLSGVRAGVRSCLEELTRARAGAGEGGPTAASGGLANTASLVHQLHHLRRQLHRLKVNCVL